MDISFLPELDPRSSFYPERFATFKAFTDQKKKISEWISDRFDEEITSELLNTELEDVNFTLSVLGIGSGDGKAEVKLLMQLMKKFRLIKCTVVEPSAEMITSYKKLVEEQKDALNGVTFDWKQASIQEFCRANADGSNKFHFVSALYSCQSVPKKDLEFCLNVITRWTEGKILIMQGADSSIFGRLEKEFPSTLHVNRPFYADEKILDSLKTLGISFETSVLTSELDVTCCFDSSSKDGKLLLDFLLQVIGCRDNGPPELMKMIEAFLKSEGISYTRNGRLYVSVPTQVIITSTSEKIANLNV